MNTKIFSTTLAKLITIFFFFNHGFASAACDLKTNVTINVFEPSTNNTNLSKKVITITSNGYTVAYENSCSPVDKSVDFTQSNSLPVLDRYSRVVDFLFAANNRIGHGAIHISAILKDDTNYFLRYKVTLINANESHSSSSENVYFDLPLSSNVIENNELAIDDLKLIGNRSDKPLCDSINLRYQEVRCGENIVYNP